MAVDPPQHGLAEVAEGEEELGDTAPALVPFELACLGVEGGRQVGPGAEGAVAGPGQHHDPHSRVHRTPGEGGEEVAHHRGRQRVALLGLVQGDRRHPAIEHDEHGLQARNSHFGTY